MHQITELWNMWRKTDRTDRRKRQRQCYKDFNIYFSTVDRLTRYKISNVTEELNTTLGLDLISIYSTLSSITAEYTFLKVYMKHLPR